jgi:hypothetical protein
MVLFYRDLSFWSSTILFAETLSRLDIPDCIFNWFVNYLNGRKHATFFNGETSTTKDINASVVQGSAGGPGMYITGTSDLRPVNDVNKLQKYADDTYLLIGSNNIDSAQPELQHLQEWAKSKNLHINKSKTREMAVVGRLRPSLALRPSVTGAARSTSIKMLGVTIGERLTVSEHVDLTVRSCASSLYALRVLREHGLQGPALHLTTRATTLARLLYASPAWWGLMSSSEVDRVEGLMRRVKRAGFLPQDAPTATQMAEAADAALFSAIIQDNNHVLRRLFPTRSVSNYNLRPRPHPFELTTKNNKIFVPRMLFKNVY